MVHAEFKIQTDRKGGHRMIRRAWRALAESMGSAFETDPGRAQQLCADYADAILRQRDAGRIAYFGMPKLQAASSRRLSGRELTAFAMLARAYERKPTAARPQKGTPFR